MRSERPPTKLARLLARGQITLPVEFRRRLGIDGETILKLTLEGDQVRIAPLRATPREIELRDYSSAEINRFLKEDRLDRATASKVRKLLGRKRAA